MELLLQTSYSQEKDIETLQRFCENRAKKRPPLGTTLLKVMAIVAGIFLIFASLTLFQSEIAFAASLLVAAASLALFFKAHSTAHFFYRRCPTVWRLRARRTPHHFYHVTYNTLTHQSRVGSHPSLYLLLNGNKTH